MKKRTKIAIKLIAGMLANPNLTGYKLPEDKITEAFDIADKVLDIENNREKREKTENNREKSSGTPYDLTNALARKMILDEEKKRK
ncbi:hypothetical protein M0Q97_01065 [Candidatus Dojkabacteria bacterium]|jgi:hypothetical protein|nr:hypothetical protein [Candidatus Dojkabacteria bacterium]